MTELYIIDEMSIKGKVTQSHFLTAYRYEVNVEVGATISYGGVDYTVKEKAAIMGSNVTVGYSYYVEEVE